MAHEPTCNDDGFQAGSRDASTGLFNFGKEDGLHAIRRVGVRPKRTPGRTNRAIQEQCRSLGVFGGVRLNHRWTDLVTIMKAWFAIPSARRSVEANVVLRKWQEKGYGIALWRDTPTDPAMCNLQLTGPYPGYAQAVNALAREVLAHDPECRFVISGGDDTEPDRAHDPETIVDQCIARFGGTFGVMQPTGDRWADGSIDRIAGSPWMGREWCERANGGAGPFWPEFTHMFSDQALMDTAVKCGVFWQRPDLIHLHRHFMRQGDNLDAVRVNPPAHLVKWNTPIHWAEMQAIYQRLKRMDFAPCMPLAAVGGVKC